MIKRRIAALINVKTIITFLVGGVFTYKAITGGLSSDYIMATVNMIFAFYFGTQKQKQDDKAENQLSKNNDDKSD